LNVARRVIRPESDTMPRGASSVLASESRNHVIIVPFSSIDRSVAYAV
jgi:hypothetical protein